MIQAACDHCGLTKSVRWYDEGEVADGVPAGGYCTPCVAELQEDG